LRVYRFQAFHQFRRLNDPSLEQRPSELQVLRSPRDHLGNPEVVGFQAPGNYTPSSRCLESNKPALPARRNHGGDRFNSLRVVAERSVEHRCLADGAIDEIGLSSFGVFERCLEALMADPDTAAAAIVADIRDGHYHHRNLIEVARSAAGRAAMPLAFVTNYSSVNHRELALEATEFGVPVLDGTREALQAFRHLFGYRDFLARPKSAPPVRPTAEVTRRWQERLRDPNPLDEVESLSLLADYGIPVARAIRAASQEEALQAAAEIGYPVVLKTAELGIEHKSEVGGVVLDLTDPEALKTAYGDLERRLGARVSVSRRIPEGVEIALGAIRDPQFGSYVMVAAGGVLIELLADSAVSLAPIDEYAAARLLGSLKVRRLLDGLRGKPAADVASVCRAIAHLSVLADDLGDTLEQLDVNPLIVSPNGCVAVDALVIAHRAT